MSDQARSHSGRLLHNVHVRQPASHATGLESRLGGTCGWEGRVLGFEDVNLTKLRSSNLFGEWFLRYPSTMRSQ